MNKYLWMQMLAARWVVLLPHGYGFVGVGYSGDA